MLTAAADRARFREQTIAATQAIIDDAEMSADSALVQAHAPGDRTTPRRHHPRCDWSRRCYALLREEPLATERGRRERLLAGCDQGAPYDRLGLWHLVQSKQVLQLNPLHECTLRTCMRLLAQMGRRAEAVSQYHSYARTLQQSLGTQPEAETKHLLLELAAAQTARPPQVQPAVLSRAAALQPAAPEVAKPRRSEDRPAPLRSAELAQLQAAWEHVSSAGAELCLVEGEAGVGKSHVSAQFAQLMAASGCRVLRGRCFESEQVLPFSCWSDLLLEAHLTEDADTLAALPPELRAELARILPALNESPPPRAADDPSAVFHALASVITCWSQAGPVCLVLEDLHWADEMGLRFLCYLTRRQLHGRCLIVATARSEESAVHAYLPRALGELAREHRLSRVTLPPFTHAETRQLAQHLAGELSLVLEGSAWLERVWQLSEGNALVILESARALTQPEVALDLSRLSVPERMRALIRRRVAALSGNARELAAVAAVYGRELQPQLFATFMNEAALCSAMQELVAAQLLRTESERILFTHDRVRETLYDEMLPSTRQFLHGRIATALTASSCSAGAALGQAGYHHAKAGNPEAAIALLLRFAEHAVRSHALGEALAALSEATKQAQSLPLGQRAALVTQLAVRQAFCLAFLGSMHGMAKLLEQCADCAATVTDPQLTASCHYWHGFALTFLGQNAHAREHAERALELAASSGDEEMQGIAHNLASHQCLLSARFAQGGQHAERALELLYASEQSEPLMFAYLNVCFHRLAQGQSASALSSAIQAEHHAQRSGSGRSVAMAALTSGVVHLYMHRWDLALGTLLSSG